MTAVELLVKLGEVLAEVRPEVEDRRPARGLSVCTPS